MNKIQFISFINLFLSKIYILIATITINDINNKSCDYEFGDQLIKLLLYKTQIKEIHDSICKCFTGRISRLINCLNGYDSKINITISQNDKISNIIILTKTK